MPFIKHTDTIINIDYAYKVNHNQYKSYVERMKRYGRIPVSFERFMRVGELETSPGEKNKNSKLKDAQIREIRQLRSEGYTYEQLANKFNISKGVIGRIVRNEGWTHVK